MNWRREPSIIVASPLPQNLQSWHISFVPDLQRDPLMGGTDVRKFVGLGSGESRE